MSSALAILDSWFALFEICQKPEKNRKMTYQVWFSIILPSNEANTKKLLYSGAKDTKSSSQVEKMKKIEKIFFDIFAPPGVPQPCPISPLWGNFSKIASMAPRFGLTWVSMPNFKSLWWSVWAVGGGTLESDIQHLQIRPYCFIHHILMYIKALMFIYTFLLKIDHIYRLA